MVKVGASVAAISLGAGVTLGVLGTEPGEEIATPTNVGIGAAASVVAAGVAAASVRGLASHPDAFLLPISAGFGTSGAVTLGSATAGVGAVTLAKHA